MSSGSKKDYLRAIHRRYRHASRKEKARILDEFCATCGYHRKHAIRLLHTFRHFSVPKHKKRGRKSRYATEDILAPLKRIWLAANLPCSKRLKPYGYPDIFRALERFLRRHRQRSLPCHRRRSTGS